MKFIINAKLYIIILLFLGCSLLAGFGFYAAGPIGMQSEYLNLSGRNFNAVSELENYDFADYSFVDLSCNNFDDDDFGALSDLADEFPQVTFLLFFNYIKNPLIVPGNLVLGVQNVEGVYLNCSPSERYSMFYDFFNHGFEFEIEFIGRIDGISTYANGGQGVFDKGGEWELRFVRGDLIVKKSVLYGKVWLSEASAECELDSNFFENYLVFTGGMSYENFFILMEYPNGSPFKNDKIGTFEVVYKFYQQTMGGVKYGPCLAELTQTITTVDKTAPRIMPVQNYSYCYVNTSYVDSGAVAYDAVDGYCDVTTQSGVNTGEIGVYEVVYTAQDLSGNVATLIKKVEVIYQPVEKVELVFETKEKYRIGETITFSVKYNDGENLENIRPVHTLFVVLNNAVYLTITNEQTFEYTLKDLGQMRLYVVVKDKLLDGTNQEIRSEEKLIFATETMWWNNTNLILIAGYFTFVMAILVGEYFVWRRKIWKIQNLKIKNL